MFLLLSRRKTRKRNVGEKRKKIRKFSESGVY